MPPKTRSQPSRGNRSVQKRGGRASHHQLSRNITRWSANKDIALLCALAKECRKDKFRISWQRVAKWVGPNVTGGAIEQHIQKLYTKLKEHRSSREPKRKKRKNINLQHDEEDGDGDYVEDEETFWDRGNEAFANVFYDKPESSTMMHLFDDVSDADQSELHGQLPFGDEDDFGAAQSLPQMSNEYPGGSQYYSGVSDSQQAFPDGFESGANQGNEIPSSLVPFGYNFDSANNNIPGYDDSDKQRFGGQNAGYQFEEPKTQSPIPHSSPKNLPFRNIDALMQSHHRLSTAQKELQASSNGLRLSQLGSGRKPTPTVHQKHNVQASGRPTNSRAYPFMNVSSDAQIDYNQLPNPLYNPFNFQGQMASEQQDQRMDQSMRAQNPSRQHREPQFDHASSPSMKGYAAGPRIADPTYSKFNNINGKVDHSQPDLPQKHSISPRTTQQSSGSILPSVEDPSIKRESEDNQGMDGTNTSYHDSYFFDQFTNDRFEDE